MHEKALNSYKITNLTKLGIDTTAATDESYLICNFCETSMSKGKDNSYVCLSCGLVEEDTTTTTLKRKEGIGPKIPQRNSRNPSVFFKNITFTQTHPDRPRSKLQELFDAEDEQTENMLKAGGCLIGDEVSINGPFSSLSKRSLFTRAK